MLCIGSTAALISDGKFTYYKAEKSCVLKLSAI
jgi:short-subunit dehydrogenase